MAKSKKSSKKKSVELKSEVVDESIYLEMAEEVVDEVVTPKVEESPEAEDMELAKRLKGHPVIFGGNYQAALARLVGEGIAADFGEDGHARGHKWRTAIKR